MKDLNLVPPLVEAGGGDALLKAGQRLFTTWSPANNSLAIAVTSAVCPHRKTIHTEAEPMQYKEFSR